MGFCHVAAGDPASTARDGAVERHGHFLTRALLLGRVRGPSSPREDKLQHSGEGAALAGEFRTRLSHLLPGLRRK